MKTNNIFSWHRLWLIVVAFCTMSVSLSAQVDMRGSSVDVTLGGGWTDFTYSAPHMRTIGNWGGQLHLGYNYFFSRYFGLGLGADITRYGGGLQVDSVFVWEDVTDPDGVHYNHILDARGWRERQEAYFFEIPMSVQVAVPFNKAAFTAAWGVKYSIALGEGTWSGNGTLTHSGEYADGIHSNIPERGFLTTTDFRPKGMLDVDNHWAMFVQIGGMYELVPGLFFSAQLYSVASIQPIFYDLNTLPLGWRDESGEAYERTPFIPMYDHSLLDSPDVVGISSTNAGIPGTEGVTSGLSSSTNYSFQIGLQLGIRFVFPTYKGAYGRCNCK